MEAAGTAADPARVINLGSVDGWHTPVFENFSYAAGKAAIHHLTRMTAAHLANRNICVNAIAPGYFDTDMIAGIYLPGNIPLDELLFFLVIPLASILTLEAVRSVKGWPVGDGSDR